MKLGGQRVRENCQERWKTTKPSWGILGTGTPTEEVPEIYNGLRKAESSILTQIRTGRIGLAAFLNKARVPDFSLPQFMPVRTSKRNSSTHNHLLPTLRCPAVKVAKPTIKQNRYRNDGRHTGRGKETSTLVPWVAHSPSV